MNSCEHCKWTLGGDEKIYLHGCITFRNDGKSCTSHKISVWMLAVKKNEFFLSCNSISIGWSGYSDVIILVKMLKASWGFLGFKFLPTHLSLVSGCNGAPLLPLLYIATNLFFNISLLNVVKISSAVVASLIVMLSGSFSFTLVCKYSLLGASPVVVMPSTWYIFIVYIYLVDLSTPKG